MSLRVTSPGLISIVMPVFDPPEAFFLRALQSVLNQSCGNWQLCLADDACRNPRISSLIEQFTVADPRICSTRALQNQGIAAATNAAISLAEGEFVAFMDHDDELAATAIDAVAKAIEKHPDVRLWYTDSDELDAAGERCKPFYKPDWNYDLLLGQNYLNHLTVIDAQLLRSVNGLRDGYQGSQDYELLLRVVEQLEGEQIGHVPQILYHWRQVADSAGRGDLAAACQAARKAISEHLQRTGRVAHVRAAKGAVIFSRVHWSLTPASVLAVVGEATAEKLQRYADLLPPESRVTAAPLSQCSPGKIINDMLASEQPDYMVFSMEGGEPLGSDTFSSLLAHVQREGVGLAGPALVNTSENTLLGPLMIHGELPELLGFCYPGSALDARGHHARLKLDQRVSALHGACMAIDIKALAASGGCDESITDLRLFGADLSQRMQRAGFASVWTPAATMDVSGAQQWQILLAQPPPGQLQQFASYWPRRPQVDPFYNRNCPAAPLDFSTVGQPGSSGP
jgi:GT2 family glycosyltransferase